MLRELRPELRAGEFVFVSVGEEVPPGPGIMASVREPEGVTLVLERAVADAAGLPYNFVAAWITLGVQSALDAVRLTAAVATRLASEGISCNVIAGFQHDHLLVPRERSAEALKLLDRP